MHIARVRHLFYPDMPRDYFYELSAQQVKIGHQVNVLTWNRNGSSSEEKVPEGFVVNRIPGLNLGVEGLVREYPYLPSLPTTIEALSPDIVHVESHLFLTSVQAARKAKKLGIPCVATVHGVFADRGVALNWAQNVYLRTFGLEIFKSTAKIICLTRSDAQEVSRFGCPSEKIRLIPNAVDIELFKPCGKNEDNLVVWVGRFVPEKGLKYLIKAAKTVVKETGHVRFLLVGYGPLKNKIAGSALDCGLLGRFVNLVGPLSRSEIAEVLSKASLFVFPSLKEGQPVSVLEAMACGLPVVGSAISGISDIVADGKTGLLVPPKDPRKLANAILTLLNNRNLQREFGQNARQFIVRNHSWEKSITELEHVYQEVMEGSESVRKLQPSVL